MMYKDSKWAREIIALQNSDGAWGYFHTLSEPSKAPMTTEQALRRLSFLGYTMDDPPIQKAVDYMNDCLSGKKQTPDRREKLHDWDRFTNLMLSTWIRRFSKENELANRIAGEWARVISLSFAGGEYSQPAYEAAYKEIFGLKPRGGRLVDFASFYQVSLTCDQYDEKTESMVFDHILRKEGGIFYIYSETPLNVLPEVFASKQASRYLGAMEILSEYRRNTGKLGFVVDWLNQNRNENGGWDMGSGANDKVYFPLSDSWRQKVSRERDCTYRIGKLIDSLSPMANQI